MSQATGERSKERLTTMLTDLPADVVRDVLGRARTLSPDDERVTVREGGDVTVDGAFRMDRTLISSLLFDAEIVDTSVTPAEQRGDECETDEIHVRLRQPIHFEGHGHGSIQFGITADRESRDVQAMTVSRTLSAEAQRSLA